MKFIFIITSLIGLSLPSNAYADGGSGVTGAAIIAWLSVEKCIMNAKVDLNIDPDQLFKKYPAQEYGPNVDRLYILGLKIFDTSFTYKYHDEEHDSVHIQTYSCAQMFPYFSGIHFPQKDKLIQFIKKTRPDVINN